MFDEMELELVFPKRSEVALVALELSFGRFAIEVQAVLPVAMGEQCLATGNDSKCLTTVNTKQNLTTNHY